MISSHCLKLGYFHSRLSSLWGGCSFRFDLDSREFQPVNLGSKLHSFFVLIITFFYWTLFLPSQIYSYHRKPDHFDEFNLAVICWIASFLGIIALVFNFFHAEDYIQLMNGGLRFMERFQAEFMPADWNPDRSYRNKILELLGFLLLLCGNCTGLVVITHMIFYPRMVFYPLSEVPERIPLGPFSFGVQLFLVSMASMANCTMISLLCFSCTVWYFTIVPIYSEELFLSFRRKYQSRAELRGELRNLMKVYRQVELLHNTLVKLGGVMIIPLQTLCDGLVLFCNLMLIRSADTSGSGSERRRLSGVMLMFLLNISLWAGFGCSLFLKMTGKMGTMSERTLKSWDKASILTNVWGSHGMFYTKEELKLFRKF